MLKEKNVITCEEIKLLTYYVLVLTIPGCRNLIHKKSTLSYRNKHKVQEII